MTRPLVLASALVLLTTPVVAQNWLGAPLEFVGSGEFLAAGDVDADGDVDLVRYGSSLLAIAWLNDGAGTFVEGPASPLRQHSSFSAAFVHLGDVDGDGVVDLCLKYDATFSGGIVPGGFVVHFGLGGGAFATGLSVDLGEQVTEVELGDADGDGDVEVGVLYSATSGANASVAWYDWTGGAFVGSASVTLGGTGASLAVGDWNGDGLADLAAAQSFSNEIVAMHTVAGAPVAVGDLTVATGSGIVVQVHGLDADGDGDDDIVGSDTNLSNTFLTAFLSDGAGGVSGVRFSTFPVGRNTQEGLFADWDGDGDAELIARPFSLGSLTPLDVFEAVGDGSHVHRFGETRYAGAPVAVVDLDGDGARDLVVGRTIVWGDGTYASVYEERYSTDATNWRAVDWEGDGDLDIVRLAGLTDRFAIEVNDGTGSFTSSGPLLPLEVTGQSYEQFAAFADFDGDSVRDVIVGSSQFLFGPPATSTFLAEWRYLGDGAGAVVPDGIAAPPLGTDMKLRPNSPVDFDGDGDLDLVATLGSIWRNDGTGKFFELPGAYAGNELLDAADVDGDGDVDLLTFGTQFVDPDLILQVNQGNGTFVPQVLLVADDLVPGVRFADLDDDGDLDVVGWVRQSGVPALGNNVSYALENVGGALQPAVPITGNTQEPSRYFVHDVDGDGASDLVTLQRTVGQTHPAYVFRRSGPGLDYEAPRTFLLNRAGDLADLDGDGDLDVLGTSTFFSPVVAPPAAGSARQYGVGVAGTGAALPLIGVAGRPVPGETMEFRVRHALGGTVALLAVGTAETALANLPFGGLTLYAGGSIVLYTLTLGGTPGAAAEGRLDLPVFVAPSQAGTTSHLQLFPVDAGSPNGLLTQSNGLELTFGS